MRNLFGEVVTKRGSKKQATRKGLSLQERGCEHCPQNQNKFVNKIKGLVRIKKRKAMAWAQSPGRQENLKLRELVGPAGQLLWETLAKFGMERDDFDIQNVVRCQPLDLDGSAEHEPTKEELHCCSVFNEEALKLNRDQAAVHLVMGKVAGVQLLGRNYRKDRPVFWHEPWNAYVVLADHSSYVLRSGGKKAGWIYFTFRDRMRAVKSIFDHPGRWGYVKAQDYAMVQTHKEMDNLRRDIEQEAKAGNRVSVDIEDGAVDGKRKILLIGFGMTKKLEGQASNWKSKARSIVLFHPEAEQKPARIDYLLKSVEEVLQEPTVEKALQHGSYDEATLLELLGIRLRGYTYDCQYATYLWKSHLRTYSLGSIIRFFFPEFADYKDTMVSEWAGNFALAPLSRLFPYNCADCDVTKRAELLTATKISLPLLQVYIRVARIIDQMQHRGPFLDREAHAKLKEIVPKYIAELDAKLKHLAGDPNFNPGSPAQVAKLLFDKLKLPQIDGRSTSQLVLETLTNNGNGNAPGLISLKRRLDKVQSTYLVGYERSADTHNGELRTIWWLTGAATTRLRSGKGDEAEAQGVINFQNLHGNPLLENLLVSDLNWRKALAT